jgi:SAM-dependent methyltransferase
MTGTGSSDRRSRDKDMSYYQLFSGMTDIQYLLLLIMSSRKPTYRNVRLPGFPDCAVQGQFTGLSGWRALLEAYNFYRRTKKYCALFGRPIANGTTILDFGCGWGRIIRFFFKDTGCDNLFGADVDPKMIDFCSEEMHCGRYSAVNPEPPSQFPDASIDVVYAYSVFSHLAESTAANWISEFSRILKPDGLLIATTRDKSFLDACEALRAKKHGSPHQQTMSRIFSPASKYKEDYDEGKFVYAATGGGGVRDESYYGEALIPKQYIEQQFANYLSPREFVSAGRPPFALPQALFVMQKRR